jgi:hypothetical protein
MKVGHGVALDSQALVVPKKLALGDRDARNGRATQWAVDYEDVCTTRNKSEWDTRVAERVGERKVKSASLDRVVQRGLRLNWLRAAPFQLVLEVRRLRRSKQGLCGGEHERQRGASWRGQRRAGSSAA